MMVDSTFIGARLLRKVRGLKNWKVHLRNFWKVRGQGMTNGEMIQKVFNCEVCEPIIEDDIIHVIFADKKDSAIGFDWSWWNAEYKEPTTKNDLGVDCISRQAVLDLINADWKYENLEIEINNLPSLTPQERKGQWIECMPGGAEEWCYKCSECNFGSIKRLSI